MTEEKIREIAVKVYGTEATEQEIRFAHELLSATTPAAAWRTNGEADPHGSHYDCERAALTLGNLTDDELANGAFMNYDAKLSIDDMLNPKPGQHMPIVWMTAVKDRIRWLSRALVKAQGAARESVDLPYVERFSESSGEGGGVYPDHDSGDFVRYTDYVALFGSLTAST
ncbi:hypothetical protein [Paraburkholderia fungorum]|nr:hypothetical protein [Paraburkholderia fungorum]